VRLRSVVGESVEAAVGSVSDEPIGESTAPCGVALHGRALLAAEFCDVDDDAVRRVMARFDGRCTRLTVAVVVRPPCPLTYCGPFSGVLLVEEARRELQVEAEQRARQLPCLAPDGVCVEHLVTASWRDLVRHAECRGYDTVLVTGRPTRLRDRLLVRRLGWSPEPDQPRARVRSTATSRSSLV
jgi:hypothetical protein